jgi:hypothetical protein
MLIGGEKYKKRKKKKRINSVVLFCILSNKAQNSKRETLASAGENQGGTKPL